MIRFLFIISALISIIFFKNTILAEECDQTNAPKKVRIYFANGMNNPMNLAKRSHKELKILIGETDKDFGLSYNDFENWYLQQYEVYMQRRNSSEEFWYWMRNPHTAPKWFSDKYDETQARFDKNMVRNDPDLTMHIRQYLADLNSGKKVVIVSHSQGNFYANNAYRHIRYHYPQYSDSIGIVSVATPATWVEGQGFSDINDVYTTNPADLVIQCVEFFYPDTLDPNVAIFPAGANNTKKHHGFVKTYLAGYSSRIKRQILNRIASLKTPEKDFDCKTPDEIPVQVETTSAGNITRTSARLHGYVQSGKQITGRCVRKPASSGNPALCVSVINQIEPSGTLDTGESFYCNIKNLAEGTKYNYRVCGREGNRISDGGVKSFTTKAPPSIPCGTPLIANGGTEGLTTTFNMGTTAGDVNVEFKAFKIKDALEIWHGNKKIYSTEGFVSGIHPNPPRPIYHDPSRGQNWQIRVYGNSNTNTAWEFDISCPSP